MSNTHDTAESLLQQRVMRSLEPLRSRLTDHPIYRCLSFSSTRESGQYRLGTALENERQHDPLFPLQIFMESHVFAVWDFMSLLKTLQQRLTCVRTPWQPPVDAVSARLINEIVLVEESDQYEDGHYASHFELYLRAMEEVGANTRPIHAFLAALRMGSSPASALALAHVQDATRAFVAHTLWTSERKTHEVAASFLLGREAVIPLMFDQVVKATAKLDAPIFKWYLKRHIEVDGEEHGPAGFRVLQRLCGADPQRWAEAEASARRALSSRHALWDGVCSALESRLGPAFVDPGRKHVV
jgi:hypothetical protein